MTWTLRLRLGRSVCSTLLLVEWLLFVVQADASDADSLARLSPRQPRPSPPPSVTNLTYAIGKTANLNCSVHQRPQPQQRRRDQANMTSTMTNMMMVMPPLPSLTWLKADMVYDANGRRVDDSFRTEKIIVTRKGIVVAARSSSSSSSSSSSVDENGGGDEDNLAGSNMRLITNERGQQQVLQLSDLSPLDEGKYICRDLDSQHDRVFYLNILSPIKELSIQFSTTTSLGGQSTNDNNDIVVADEEDVTAAPTSDSHTVSIREQEELVVKCLVSSSKPAANLSVWLMSRASYHQQQQQQKQQLLMQRQRGFNTADGTYVAKRQPHSGGGGGGGRRRRKRSRTGRYQVTQAIAVTASSWSNNGGGDVPRSIPLVDSHTLVNKDGTMRSVAFAKHVISRADNDKYVACVAENGQLNEKWETKRQINVLYAPKCASDHQWTYHTGINQSIELECRMSDANPPYLNFKWTFNAVSATSNNNNPNNNPNNNNNNNVVRTNGMSSRVKWTPHSVHDFGEIGCSASNGLGSVVDCRLTVSLGGAPNPPHDCYHKENNHTVIIECKPGFDQGDPEVYFYLLKMKANGMLVEYARKRDSCSFLISTLILEEHLNTFYVYSSNRYGSNRHSASQLVIENRAFLVKHAAKANELMESESNRRWTVGTLVVLMALLVLFVLCFVSSRCRTSTSASTSVNAHARAHDTASLSGKLALMNGLTSHHNHHHQHHTMTDGDEASDDDNDNHMQAGDYNNNNNGQRALATPMRQKKKKKKASSSSAAPVLSSSSSLASSSINNNNNNNNNATTTTMTLPIASSHHSHHSHHATTYNGATRHFVSYQEPSAMLTTIMSLNGKSRAGNNGARSHSYSASTNKERNINHFYDEKSSLDSMQTNIYDNANAGTTLLLFNPKSACNNNGSKRQQAGSKPSVPTTSNSKTKQSPSLINNLQDLDMSPKSKQKLAEKAKASSAATAAVTNNPIRCMYSPSSVNETSEAVSDYTTTNTSSSNNTTNCTSSSSSSSSTTGTCSVPSTSGSKITESKRNSNSSSNSGDAFIDEYNRTKIKEDDPLLERIINGGSVLARSSSSTNMIMMMGMDDGDREVEDADARETQHRRAPPSAKFGGHERRSSTTRPIEHTAGLIPNNYSNNNNNNSSKQLKHNFMSASSNASGSGTSWPQPPVSLPPPLLLLSNSSSLVAIAAAATSSPRSQRKQQQQQQQKQQLIDEALMSGDDQVLGVLV